MLISTKEKQLQMKWNFLMLIGLLALSQSCAVQPKEPFGQTRHPQAPDYSQLSSWAAHPAKNDPADSVSTMLPQKDRVYEMREQIDVFFLHPTTYTGKRGHELWNGPVDDPDLNKRTDEGTILYQASIFNGVGQVYAPRYRQAHLECYFTDDKKSAKAAFDLAYQDVKAAFSYYLEHYNNGRPILLASHSQGTTHAKQLMKEFFDGQPLQQQLVAAYIVGIPVKKDEFESISYCQNSSDTQCFVSWRSYKKGKYPDYHEKDNNVLAVNPLNWTTSNDYIPKSENDGGILLDFDEILPNLAGAQVHDGLLWLEKPKFPGSFLYWAPNYHAGDFNLYYLDVRRNTAERARQYLKTISTAP